MPATNLIQIQYNEAIKGHYEHTSANALRNSVKMVRNLDVPNDRFRSVKKGGHYSNTNFSKSTLKLNVR